MHEGEIVERGTHEDLMSLQGKYTSMWNLQQREEEKNNETPLVSSLLN